MKKTNNYRAWIGMILFLLFSFPITIFAAEKGNQNAVEQARNGIVEIRSGFKDSNGNFHTLESSSGCLVCNDDGYTYVVTTYHSVANSKEKKENYCKSNGIHINESSELTDSIQVVVRGDVIVEASVLNKSEIQDYCILSLESVLKEKSAMKLGSIRDVYAGDRVCTLGFSKGAETDSSAQFTASEVLVHEGTVSNANVRIGESDAISHSALVDKGNSGGALIDSNGYLIGLNNVAYANAGGNVQYSLAIDEIRKVLDNYGIVYESNTKDDTYDELTTLFELCSRMEKSGKYKADSVEQMQQTLQEVENILNAEEHSQDEMEQSILKLKKAQKQLKEKMPGARKFAIILGVVCLILLVKLIHLIIVSRDDKESEVIEERTINMVQLAQIRTGKVMTIEKQEFLLGKNPQQVDFAVPDNSTISRVHAAIRFENGKYVIYDLGSSNGTRINGKLLSSNNAVLHDDDVIQLANEQFVFKC